MRDVAASADEFGAGWSAILTGGRWVILEPTDEHTGDPRPALLPAGLLCIITSDNPYGSTRSLAENQEGRHHLLAWAQASTREVHETAGGIGSVRLPTTWPAYESGVLVPVADYTEAVEHCVQFAQAAIYVLDGDERVLIDSSGSISRRQRYRTHLI